MTFERDRALYVLVAATLFFAVLSTLAAALPYVEVLTREEQGASVGAQAIPKQRMGWVVADKLTTKNDAGIWGTLETDTINEYTGAGGVTIDGLQISNGAISETVPVTGSVNATGDLTAGGGLAVTGTASLARGVEHLGALTFITQSITHTAGSGVTGTLAAVADGEVWLVYDVFIQTTETFTDTAGNDEAFTIGDGNDADGFLSATSTELDSTFTEATGYPAGFYGVESGSNGAYTVDDGIFVYAPSGSDETIDYALSSGAGDDIGAGALTMYLTYARIE